MEEFYGQVVANSNFFGVAQIQMVLLGFLVLLMMGLLPQSEVFQRLVVDSRIRRELDLAFAAYGLPLLIVLMEVQRVRKGGGLFRFLGIFLLVVLVVIVGLLALIAFLLYRFLRRRG